MARLYYFGCIDHPGHYLFDDSHCRVIGVPLRCPWTIADLDTPYAPTMPSQTEGAARFLYKNGWTLLSFWDRSLDSRRNSHSTWIADEEMTFDELCTLADARFHSIWQRYGFEIELHAAPAALPRGR